MTALHHATQKAIILDRQFRARVIPNKKKDYRWDKKASLEDY
jgi:hypothetical protein